MSIQPISNNIGMFWFITIIFLIDTTRCQLLTYIYINIVLDGLHLDDDEHGDAQENAMEDVNQNESNVRESSDFMDGEHIRGPEFDDAT